MDFGTICHCNAIKFDYLQIMDAQESSPATRNPKPGGTDMTRDELNRELRMHSASWQAVAVVYGAIVGTLVLSAMSIVT